jgi:hypothetical protein
VGETERALVELAPDSVVRFNHVRSNARAPSASSPFYGADGGYEIPFLSVTELGPGGKLERNDLYDPEQLDEAFARFREIAAEAPTVQRFANAATRAAKRIIACWSACDWQGLVRMLPAGLQFADRRRMALLEGGREQYVEWLRVTGEMASTEIQVQLLATRGDRLALQRRCVQLADGDVGPSEMANVTVIETNAGGDPVAVIHFDEDALDAAYAELDARWRAREATAHPRVAAYQVAFTRALASRDWEALTALHAATLVAHDHRLVRWDVLRGSSAYVGALRAMVDLAPDARGRLDPRADVGARAPRRGRVGRDARRGCVREPVPLGRRARRGGQRRASRFYDPHHLDAARARFEQIGTSAPEAAHARLAKPNVVSAAVERWQTTFEMGAVSGEWDPMRAICRPTMVWDDRRRFAQISGDRELFIASLKERVAMGARFHRRLLGTAGDRVGIFNVLWSGGPSDGTFEIEFLSVFEVDEAGLLTAMVLFNADDRGARAP